MKSMSSGQGLASLSLSYFEKYGPLIKDWASNEIVSLFEFAFHEIDEPKGSSETYLRLSWKLPLV